MDSYCERVEPGLWAEPLNAVSNVAFHTTATQWGTAADSGFILVFLLYYIVLFTHDFAGVTRRWAWLAAPAFVAFTALVALTANAAGFGGPGMYLSALLVQAGIAVWWRGPERRLFVLAGVIFTVSLTFRTLDEPLCDTLPTGTHYAWHILNAVTLYLVSLAVTRRSAQRLAE